MPDELTPQQAREKEAFEKAQQIFLQELKEEMTDRPGHLEYLDAAMDADPNGPDVPLTTGTSSRIADAIDADVAWIRQTFMPGYIHQPPPREYRSRRQTDRRAAAKRERTKGSLESLLRVDLSNGSD